MTASADDLTAAAASPPPAPARTGPRTTLWLLRGASVVHLLSLALQPILAGYYLSGDFDMLELHSVNAGLLTLFAMVQIGAAVTYVWPGRGRIWPLAFAVVLFLAEGMQHGMGYARELGIHLPLGVAILASQLLFTVWILRSAARRPRPRLRNRNRKDPS